MHFFQSCNDMFSISKIFQLRRELLDPLHQLNPGHSFADFESPLHHIVPVAVLHQDHYRVLFIPTASHHYFFYKESLFI